VIIGIRMTIQIGGGCGPRVGKIGLWFPSVGFVVRDTRPRPAPTQGCGGGGWRRRSGIIRGCRTGTASLVAEIVRVVIVGSSSPTWGGGTRGQEGCGGRFWLYGRGVEVIARGVVLGTGGSVRGVGGVGGVVLMSCVIRGDVSGWLIPI